jgi:hypothetical protein
VDFVDVAAISIAPKGTYEKNNHYVFRFSLFPRGMWNSRDRIARR